MNPEEPNVPSRMDFYALDIASLRRYQKHHHISITSKQPDGIPTRDELVKAIERHFTSQQAYEPDAVAWFVYSVRKRDHALKLTQQHFSYRG
jgi:hypothetical protein